MKQDLKEIKKSLHEIEARWVSLFEENKEVWPEISDGWVTPKQYYMHRFKEDFNRMSKYISVVIDKLPKQRRKRRS